MKVCITQKDIDEGKKNSRRHCPIARALTRKGLDDVMVNTTLWHYKPIVDEDHQTFIFPYPAMEFIHGFDRGYPVEPITLEL